MLVTVGVFTMVPATGPSTDWHTPAPTQACLNAHFSPSRCSCSAHRSRRVKVSSRVIWCSSGKQHEPGRGGNGRARGHGSLAEVAHGGTAGACVQVAPALRAELLADVGAVDDRHARPGCGLTFGCLA